MSYEDAKALVPRGHKKIANNTKLQLIPEELIEDVEWNEYIVMLLHGHTVAEFHPDHIKLFSAGWFTPTTKDRLNLALYLAGISYNTRIWQKDWQWYYGNYQKGDPKFYDGMKIGYNGKVIA